jgi:DNA-directed RNA polymerase subunit RPC12/RpoP
MRHSKKDLLGDVDLIIKCVKCGKELREKITQLKRDPTVTCGCGAVIRIDAKQLRKAAGPIDDDAQGKLF